jgi:chromosomal replication initiation ATPase DnaA
LNYLETSATPPQSLRHPFAAMSFSTYVQLPGNRDAHAALLRWCTTRARDTMSPVVLVGPSAVGKTHLVRAALAVASPPASGSLPLYSSAADLRNALVSAIKGGRMRSFEARMRWHRGLVAVEHLEDLATSPQSRRSLLDLLASASLEGRRLLLTVTQGKGRRPPAALLQDVLARFPRAQIVRLHRPTPSQQRRVLRAADTTR